MAKLKGAAKRAFLARMAKGRAKKTTKHAKTKRKNEHTSKRKTHKSRGYKSKSMAKRKSGSRMKSIGGRGKLINAAKGAAIGLAIKYAQGKFAPNSPGLGEAGANIAASYFGKTEGVLAYQVGKIALAAIPSFTGTVPGTGSGGMA